MSEMSKVSSRAASRVQLCEAERGRGHGAVAQGVQRRVSDVDGMLDRLLPIRVLVADGREYLVAVVAVHVADVRSEDAVSK